MAKTSLINVVAQNHCPTEVGLGVVVDVCVTLVNGTYTLEGDGLLVVEAYEFLKGCEAQLHCPVDTLPNVHALLNKWANPNTHATLVQYIDCCVQLARLFYIPLSTEGTFLSGSAPRGTIRAARVASLHAARAARTQHKQHTHNAQNAQNAQHGVLEADYLEADFWHAQNV